MDNIITDRSFLLIHLSSAYLLVSHGSRDLRPQLAVAQLARQISDWLSVRSSPVRTSPPGGRSIAIHEVKPLVTTACLELARHPLHWEIAAFAQYCLGAQIDRVVILPLFLLPGVHVMDDIPREVELARLMVGDDIELKIAPYLGSYSHLARLLARPRQVLPSSSILLAHGSRRLGGNEIVEQLANRLEMTTAYWSVAPSLADRVSELVQRGAAEIGILPYFLFPGGITDAIADLVTQLRKQFPTTNLLLEGAMFQESRCANGTNPGLIETIGEILLSAAN